MTDHQLACLAWAVETCAAMRGMLTGGPAQVLEEFDSNISTARAALATIQPTPTTPTTPTED